MSQDRTPRRVLIARIAVGVLAVPAMLLLSNSMASAATLPPLEPVGQAIDDSVQVAPILGAVDDLLGGVTDTATGTVGTVTDTATGTVGDVTGSLPGLDDVTGSLPGAGDLPSADLPALDLDVAADVSAALGLSLG